MHETSLSSYEEVPYLAKPLYPTHPDCIGTVATLLGMAPAAPARCRVLELGCATGGNLIPMALALPESTFVGIDLSPRQIDMGTELIGRLKLPNIKLQALSIMDVGEDFGEFDYIICHGVYSWVPPPVQDKILSICKHNLTPRGVAYISYNTYPGWHGRSIARDLMRFHCRQFDDPPTRIQQARAFLTFMARAVEQPESAYGRVLRYEAESLAKEPDQYLFHEHLEDANYPCYFHEFAGRAAAKGLQYLGESWYHTALDNLDPEVAEAIQEISADLIRLEQYLDFLRNRTFRRTLLCHDGLPLNRTPDPSIMDGFHVSALARPASASPSLAPEVAEVFATDAGARATTNMPLLKAALVTVLDVWPRALSFDELWQAVSQRVSVPANGRPYFAAAMLHLYLTNMLTLHIHPPRFVLQPGEKPLASPLARVQAETSNLVTNLRHRLVPLDEPDRAVLRQLDGTRDRSALAEFADLDAALQRLAKSAVLQK